jgi:PhzF family phenazine biosynthesis protein
MSHPIYQVDAFASELFKGNPASVVILNKWPDDKILQQIAQENNLSETAFITPHKAQLQIRWFTPTTEVDLCGHATLAAAHVLFNHEDLESDEVIFHSKSGILTVTQEKDVLTLNFPADDIKVINELPELLLLDIQDKLKEIYRGKTDIMFVLDKQEHVYSYQPDFEILKMLNCRGIILTAPGESVDFVSRFFAPRAGINEDAVTGSAHTTMTPFWAKRLKKTKLTARQLSVRGGDLVCELKGTRVFMSGHCKTYFKGELFL